MATGLYNWSKTPGNNASATYDWREGMAPSAVNDSARGIMADVAKYRDDTGGNLVTDGSGTAYTVSTNSVFSSTLLMDCAELTLLFHATSGTNPTLNVDGLGAKAITIDGTNAPPAGTLVAGTPYVLVYYNNGPAWRIKNFYQVPYTVPLGGMIPYTGATSPNAAFVIPLGQAISRTTYAAYFALVGTTYGVGDGSTTFNVIDMGGRVPAGKEAVATRLTTAGGGVDGATLGSANALTQNATILQANLPAVTLATTITDPGHAHSYQQAQLAGGAGASGTVLGFNAGATTGSSTTGITASTALGGSGAAFKIVQPTIICNYLLRII